jgi:leader peptidase (prepilin peptidase)/N-methyltransferase
MHAFWTIFLAATGACVGSFLNVVVYRMPRGQSIVLPPSHCPKCGRRIRWYDNVPILSWLALRGRCRFCRASISPRYIIVEALTAALVAGLYVCYYVLRVRRGAGDFIDTWPTFAAHAALLCGLLACSLVDMEHWIVPLEVCWVVSVVGIVSAAAKPTPSWLPQVSPGLGAAAAAAGIGLIVGLVLMRYGVIPRSFADATARPAEPPQKIAARLGRKKDRARSKARKKARSVAIGKDQGVWPRLEVLKELLFLMPAIVLAVAAGECVEHVAFARDAWSDATTGMFGRHVTGLLSALVGYMVGGAWIWGTRILGTLGFGKEAMGLGDVHILAAVGAVTGWIVPSLTFFAAPVFGLLWALYLLIRRNQRELPYGPWLAAAAVAVMLAYDPIRNLLAPHADAMKSLLY